MPCLRDKGAATGCRAGEVDQKRRWALVSLHKALDGGAASGLNLGCQYVDETLLADLDATHPTWTHGRMVDRALSGITRAELVRNGYALLGRDPQEVLPSMTDDDVRRASLSELNGYWARAARRPWWWLNPVMVDLGLTSMARGRHTLATGQLLTKTQAIDACRAPTWLVDQMQARRQGQDVTSPRLWSGWLAWQDVRRTTWLSRQTSREVNNLR